LTHKFLSSTGKIRLGKSTSEALKVA